MSRTIRRKHFEKTVLTGQCNPKVAGYYSEWIPEDEREEPGVWLDIYREPTAVEYFTKWKKVHLDGSRLRNHSSFSRVVRRFEQKRHRSMCETVIHRYTSGTSEDAVTPVYERNRPKWW